MCVCAVSIVMISALVMLVPWLFPVYFLLVYPLEGFLTILFIIYRLIGPTLGGYLSKVENIKGVIRVFPIFKDVFVCLTMIISLASISLSICY